jgi:hypothetical protein
MACGRSYLVLVKLELATDARFESPAPLAESSRPTWKEPSSLTRSRSTSTCTPSRSFHSTRSSPMRTTSRCVHPRTGVIRPRWTPEGTLIACLPLLQYDTWIKSEEWTFLACVALGAGHALSFLITRWSIAMRARITCVPVSPAPLWPLVRAVDRTAGRPRLTSSLFLLGLRPCDGQARPGHAQAPSRQGRDRPPLPQARESDLLTSLIST